MSRRKRTLKLGWRELWPIWLVFGILIAIGIFGVRMMFPVPKTTRVLAASEDLKLNVSELDPATANLFSYPLTPQDRVEFFVKRGAGSDVMVAFASCRRCYRSGHYQQGGQIFCGHCNEPMERLTAGQIPAAEKDCKQVPIPFERSGDQLTVRAHAVREVFTRWFPEEAANGPRN